MTIEVEQKYILADRARLEAQLVELGCEFDELIEQVDSYFAHPGRDFAQTDEALRLRQVGHENYITYKGPKLDTTTKSRREIEIALASGPATAADTVSMLTALGFKLVRQVSKQRVRATVGWHGWLTEICLDRVAKLGDFAELEIMADEHKMAEATQTIASLAAHLGLIASERRSYLELLLATES